jgi:hypothetical protein
LPRRFCLHCVTRFLLGVLFLHLGKISLFCLSVFFFLLCGFRLHLTVFNKQTEKHTVNEATRRQYQNNKTATQKVTRRGRHPNMKGARSIATPFPFLSQSRLCMIPMVTEAKRVGGRWEGRGGRGGDMPVAHLSISSFRAAWPNTHTHTHTHSTFSNH